MRNLFTTTMLALTVTTAWGAAHAQDEGRPRPPVTNNHPFSNLDEGPAPPPLFPPRLAAPLCGSNGYAPPLYNGDFEQANNCIGIEVRQAASAIGMGRLEPLGVKSINRIRFSADAVDAAGAKSEITAYLSYIFNASRVTRDSVDKNGKTVRVVQVYRDGEVWDEAQPGIEPRDAARGASPAERQIWQKLTPFGALWSVIEAEGNTKVTTVGGQTVLSGASPYDKIPVVVTLDAKHMPIRVEARQGKDSYVATFSGYTQKWEPDYLVSFPSKLIWTKNGKPYFDLTTTEFKSNPYAIFPSRADLVAAAASKPEG